MFGSQYPMEKIVSNTGDKELGLFLLMQIYEALGIERFPIKNRHEDNWNNEFCQSFLQVQDPIISCSSKSLVLGLNHEQVCKIRLDDNAFVEIDNIQYLSNQSDLFPKFYSLVDLPEGLIGIIMERIPIIHKTNFTSGELNRLYYDFRDSLNHLHSMGILHNDLGKAHNSDIRPNIVLSTNRIRLLDFEKIAFKHNSYNWGVLYENEMEHVQSYFHELINYACHTLT